MPIPLGILAAAGFRPSAAGAFELLESTVLTGTQASVEFTNLTTNYASLYQHLQIRAAVRSTTSGTLTDDLFLRLNSDTGNNYAWHSMENSGSSVLSQASVSTNLMRVGRAPRAGVTANAFAVSVIDLLDPFETNKNTTVRTLSGSVSTPFGIFLNSGFWNNTASVTSALVLPATGSFPSGTRISLYGIRGS